MGNAFNLAFEEDDLVRIVIDLPGEKANKLTKNTLYELDQILNELKENTQIQAITIESGKRNIFIAGADINEIADIADPQDGARKASAGQAILNKISDLPIPTIAVIDGACLGGGLELALACKYRISTDNKKTCLGLPEVKLGIIPGFGGTQRLPRLIGLQRGLSMILSGKPMDGLKAFHYKLTDAYFSREFLAEKTSAFIKTIQTQNGRKKISARRRRGHFQRIIHEKNPISGYFIFNIAKQNLLEKTKNFYPAPMAALDVMKKTRSMVLSKGLKVEAEEFGKLAAGAVSKNLVKLFFINENIKRDTSSNGESKLATISKAGVLGAGVRGGGISWLFTKAMIPVRLKDLNWNAIGNGYHSASKIYQTLSQLGKYNDREINLRMHLLSGTTDYTGFDKLDVVVEAVTEEPEVKEKIYSELEDHVSADTIIATNSSTIPISDMIATFKHPERFIGMHFLNPVNRMPLVEIIPDLQTSPKTIATIIALVKRLGKTPIKVRNCPGFLINRLLMPYLNEAIQMLQEGIEALKIDLSFCRFGMPTGPLTLLDQIGLDVAYKAADVLEKAYGSRLKTADLLSVAFKEKRLLGKKGGRGIYLYNGRPRELNPEITQAIQNLKSQNSSGSRSLSEQDIVERAIFAMINEASRCIQEKIVDSPEHLDMALILGTGFPAFRGGLLCYADTIGIEKVVEKTRKLSDIYGERFNPSDLLVEMGKKGAAFYGSKTF